MNFWYDYFSFDDNTAFLGYILPWGQMSFWGAMVITSLLAAIPLIGADLIFLLWVVTVYMMRPCIDFTVTFYFAFYNIITRLCAFSFFAWVW